VADQDHALERGAADVALPQLPDQLGQLAPESRLTKADGGRLLSP